MSDLIRRSELDKKIRQKISDVKVRQSQALELKERDHVVDLGARCMAYAYWEILDLLSKEPDVKEGDNERPRGKWFWSSHTSYGKSCESIYYCTCCRHKIVTRDSEPWERFCPQCGVDMRTEE